VVGEPCGGDVVVDVEMDMGGCACEPLLEDRAFWGDAGCFFMCTTPSDMTSSSSSCSLAPLPLAATAGIPESWWEVMEPRKSVSRAVSLEGDWSGECSGSGSKPVRSTGGWQDG